MSPDNGNRIKMDDGQVTKDTKDEATKDINDEATKGINQEVTKYIIEEDQEPDRGEENEEIKDIEAADDVEEDSDEEEEELANDLLKDDDNEQPTPQDVQTTRKIKTSLCSKCQKRQSRRGCCEIACFACCSNQTNCPAHKEIRGKVLWKQQVLEGTTTVNRLAQEMRQRKLQTKQFREPGFCYLGDTVLIWSLKEFGRHTTWKEEAIRKSERRRRYLQSSSAATTPTSTPAAAKIKSLLPSDGAEGTGQKELVVNRKKRKFHQIMEMLHQQSVQYNS